MIGVSKVGSPCAAANIVIGLNEPPLVVRSDLAGPPTG